ncbi:MAG: rod shape-determining protein MreC [Rhodothermales bacterium]|nr:rod shape-determining protein MreC [Rhodothermales bacterium]
MIKLWDKIGDWVILFVLLLLAGIFLRLKNESAVRGLRAQSLEFAAGVEGKLSWIGDYLRAVDENSRLRADNIRLSSQVARSREAEIENGRLRRLLGLRDTLAAPTVAADIVAKDLTRQRNLLTINAGRVDGVAPDMAVVDESGIVGKVVLVSDRYARVMPYLNTDLRIPAKVQPSEAPGIVRWDGNRRDRLIMDHVVKTELVSNGQLVVASGYSQVYPPGFPVGVIDSVIARPGRIELVLHLRPAANIEKTEHVFVVLAQPDTERLAIERETPR